MPESTITPNRILVTINNVALTPLEVQGARVITLAMVDEVHGRPSGTARKRFNDNRPRMTEGKHFFVRKTDEAAAMGFTAPNGLTLLTDRGYLMLVKSFTDDLAWQVQDMLVESYFAKPAASIVPMIPQTLPEALRLAADLADDLSAERAKTATMAPKVDAFERISGADGSLCVTDTAKALQQRPKDLTLWLQANSWAYRRAGNMPLLGYQPKVQQGYLTHKVTPYTKADGVEGFNEQMRVTPKGIAKLALIFGVDVAGEEAA